MKRLAGIAVAATILAAMGLLGFWFVVSGNSISIAFADVANALDNIRTVVFDVTVETKNLTDGKEDSRIKMKHMFLAPLQERIEVMDSKDSSISIVDGQTGKMLVLSPGMKTAMVIDGLGKVVADAQLGIFNFVRQLVREGNSGSGEKFKLIGKKEIEGKTIVGFRESSDTESVTIWADSQNARLVCVETDQMDTQSKKRHTKVMNNFRYDIELDSSLFSLEPPASYTKAVDDDLVYNLRFLAECNNGTFPSEFGVSNYMQVFQAAIKKESEKLLKTPEAQTLMEKLKSKYGEDKVGFTEAWTKEQKNIIAPFVEKLTQKHMPGMIFWMHTATMPKPRNNLRDAGNNVTPDKPEMITRPENDLHYAGKDVKLGTPNRPVFWYKWYNPTGADKYHVIYADLSIKELDTEQVKKLSEACFGNRSKQ